MSAALADGGLTSHDSRTILTSTKRKLVQMWRWSNSHDLLSHDYLTRWRLPGQTATYAQSTISLTRKTQARLMPLRTNCTTKTPHQYKLNHNRSTPSTINKASSSQPQNSSYPSSLLLFLTTNTLFTLSDQTPRNTTPIASGLAHGAASMLATYLKVKRRNPETTERAVVARFSLPRSTPIRRKSKV